MARSPLLSLLCVGVLSLLVTTKVVEAQTFARVCSIDLFAPKLAVAYDQASDSYAFLSVDPLDDDNGIASNHGDIDTAINSTEHSNLRRRRRQLASGVPAFMIPSDSSRRVTNNDSKSDNTVFEVRECPCATDMYCHVDLDTCGVPASYSDPVGCFAKSTKKTLLRNAWPLLLLWYSTILFFILCTEKGRNARNFILLKVCKSNLNERIVDRFLFTHGFLSVNPFAAATGGSSDDTSQPFALGNWLPVARPVGQDRTPTALVLKTRIYGVAAVDNDDNNNNNNNSNTASSDGDNEGDAAATSNDDDDGSETNNTPPGESGEACCTICFSGLEVGDRVGNLPCQHTFHVDCLREWLPRRNVCPLCQNDNAATPRYAREATTTTAGEGDDDDDNNNSGETNSNDQQASDDDNEGGQSGQITANLREARLAVQEIARRITGQNRSRERRQQLRQQHQIREIIDRETPPEPPPATASIELAPIETGAATLED